MRFNSYMGQRSWGRRAQSPLVPLEKPIPGVFRSCVLLVVELRLLRSVVVSIGRAVTFHHAWHVCLCRDPEQGMGSGCRTLMPQHSYRTGVKRCKGFAPGFR